MSTKENLQNGNKDDLLIGHVETKNIMTKSSLPVGGYSVNPYVGCTHACKYCYASFMKRFTGHTEVFFARPKSKKLQRKIQRVALYFPHSCGSRFGNFLGPNPLLSISSYRA